jgi:hypothetical protein
MIGELFVGIGIGFWAGVGIIVLGWVGGMVIRGINFILSKLG